MSSIQITIYSRFELCIRIIRAHRVFEYLEFWIEYFTSIRVSKILNEYLNILWSSKYIEIFRFELNFESFKWTNIWTFGYQLNIQISSSIQIMIFLILCIRTLSSIWIFEYLEFWIEYSISIRISKNLNWTSISVFEDLMIEWIYWNIQFWIEFRIV